MFQDRQGHESPCLQVPGMESVMEPGSGILIYSAMKGKVIRETPGVLPVIKAGSNGRQKWD